MHNRVGPVRLNPTYLKNSVLESMGAAKGDCVQTMPAMVFVQY